MEQELALGEVEEDVQATLALRGLGEPIMSFPILPPPFLRLVLDPDLDLEPTVLTFLEPTVLAFLAPFSARFEGG